MSDTFDPAMTRLSESTYPGRGIAIGMTPDERHAVQVYWIMGRSSGSRNRIFVRDGDAVRTVAADESRLHNPSLFVYYPVRSTGRRHVVTNGDQTDTIVEHLQAGRSFEEALFTRTFEPDPPILTPRISGIVDLDDAIAYRLSILKTEGKSDAHAVRQFFAYETFIPGRGHCITTYADDGDPVPSFEGEPFRVEFRNGLQETADLFWNTINEDNRVSLLAKFIDASTNSVEITLINKHG